MATRSALARRGLSEGRASAGARMVRQAAARRVHPGAGDARRPGAPPAHPQLTDSALFNTLATPAWQRHPPAAPPQRRPAPSGRTSSWRPTCRHARSAPSTRRACSSPARRRAAARLLRVRAPRELPRLLQRGLRRAGLHPQQQGPCVRAAQRDGRDGLVLHGGATEYIDCAYVNERVATRRRRSLRGALDGLLSGRLLCPSNDLERRLLQQLAV